MLVAADRKQAGRGIEFESTLFTAKPIGRARHDHADGSARELPSGSRRAGLLFASS
jgi:hypothetical protein